MMLENAKNVAQIQNQGCGNPMSPTGWENSPSVHLKHFSTFDSFSHACFHHQSRHFKLCLSIGISCITSCSDVPHCGSSLPTGLCFWLAGHSNIYFHKLLSILAAVIHRRVTAYQKLPAEANAVHGCLSPVQVFFCLFWCSDSEVSD